LSERNRKFEAATLPHLNAAYNLARWLLRDDHGAQDVVQEAYLRAFRYFDSFRGGDAKPWLLGIVRNTSLSVLRGNRHAHEHVEFDEQHTGAQADSQYDPNANNPEVLLLRKLDRAAMHQAIDSLPVLFREVLILRELEELSYDEIAQVVEIPLGTVMSRLSRARALLRMRLQSGD
jgi:RNA polymerase sigma factor (sigma-70 family)